MPVRLPWPKIPKHPAKNRCSSPSRSVCCAARNLTSACAIVNRTVLIRASRRIGKHDVPHERVEVAACADELAEGAHSRREGIELVDGETSFLVGSAEVREMVDQGLHLPGVHS